MQMWAQRDRLFGFSVGWGGLRPGRGRAGAERTPGPSAEDTPHQRVVRDVHVSGTGKASARRGQWRRLDVTIQYTARHRNPVSNHGRGSGGQRRLLTQIGDIHFFPPNSDQYAGGGPAGASPGAEAASPPPPLPPAPPASCCMSGEVARAPTRETPPAQLCFSRSVPSGSEASYQYTVDARTTASQHIHRGNRGRGKCGTQRWRGGWPSSGSSTRSGVAEY